MSCQTYVASPFLEGGSDQASIAFLFAFSMQSVLSSKESEIMAAQQRTQQQQDIGNRLRSEV
jgi:hypothetical protein